MSTDRIVPLESSPPTMPRHWQFAAMMAWEGAYQSFKYGSDDTARTILLQQLVTDFLADPLIRADSQQRTIWTQLHDQIRQQLIEELREPLIVASVLGGSSPAPAGEAIATSV